MTDGGSQHKNRCGITFLRRGLSGKSRCIKPTSSGLVAAPTERTSLREATATPQQSNHSKQTQEIQTSDVTSGYLCSYSICGWYKTLFLDLEFTGRTDGCLKWATQADKKWKVIQILLQTSLDLLQMYHLGDIFHFPQRHCPCVLLETAFLSAKARKVTLQTVIH